MIASDLTRLLQLTPRAVIERSRKCTAQTLHNRIQSGDDGHNYLEVITKAHCSESEHSYLTVFRFDRFGEIKSAVHHPTWVRCSCPYFLYYVEVALTRHGSSSVYYSNGRYPMIRNPKLRPYLCKHLIAATNPAVHVLLREMADLKKKEKAPTKVKRKISDLLKNLLKRGGRNRKSGIT
jgi:hypothetical protein